METVTRAIIIAAGEGKRLRPVTETTPKPLIKVNGVRIIDTIIKALKENGIHEIYIVVGYKKEQFYKVYQDDSDIRILENPYYKEGNNITSMYVARQYLQDAAVIEGDILVRNEAVFSAGISESCYCGKWFKKAPEWAVKTDKGHIISCCIEGADNASRIWGISMWTKKDGIELSEMIRQQFEEKKDWSLYWDEIALMRNPGRFCIGIRNIEEEDLIEIDTVTELAEIDHSYQAYCK